MNKDFFMNYAEGQGAPTVKYDNETTATKEAERLAEKLGVRVATLKAVTSPRSPENNLKTFITISF
jgi:hypothetical protein